MYERKGLTKKFRKKVTLWLFRSLDLNNRLVVQQACSTIIGLQYNNRLVVQACTHREKGWCKSTLFLAGMSHRVTGGSILVPELNRRSSYFILCNSFAFAVIRLHYWNPRPCYPRGPLSITGKLHYEGKDKPSSEKRFNRIQLNTEVA